jgi:hypothetical protein
MINRLKPAILILMHLLLVQYVFGQSSTDMTGYLRQRFTEYCKAVPWEEVFVHTDREEYISGENLWFNIFLTDRQSFKMSSNSSIVYFEILNSKNRPVVQKRVLIEKGEGPGQIVLPDTLSTGAYTIRAYTSWMKNFLPYNCFMKNILVFNAINPSKSIGFQFNTYLSGKDNDTQKETDQDATIRINDSRSDSLEIFIEAGKQSGDGSKNTFYIFIQTHGNIDYVSSERTTGKSARISLPKTLLRPGINQITLFNSLGQPISERYIYTPLNRQDRISINSPDSCGLRDKVVVDIELPDLAGTALDFSGISISVSPLQVKGRDDISDYMVLGSEFGPGMSIVSSDKKDSVLRYLKSNWIDWKEILSKNKHNFKYPAEKADHFIMGDLVTNENVTVGNSEYVLMCIPGKEAGFQYAKTDSTGNFCFPLHIDEGLKDLIIMPGNENSGRKINIESSFSDKFIDQAAYKKVTVTTDPQFESRLSVNHQVRKIYDISSVSTPRNTGIKPIAPVRFYGKPDIELVLADYINLPVMSEIIFELLPGVSLKKKKTGDEISITYHAGDIQYTTTPCLMIDGVIIRDASLISNLDPEIVQKIDVIREKYLVGRYFFPGIINVITKTGDFSCVTLPDYMIRMRYKVLDPVNSFVSPDYSTQQARESRLPDYRNTLYWNPSATTKSGKAVIEFWSSDNKADYQINIQGVTKNGKIISGHKILKVR